MSILDSILVYATLIMWMNLSPYRNLRNAEKIKSALRILQGDFYSVYLTHQFVTSSGKSVYSNVIVFLIAADWCSAIIVSNLLYIRFLRISSINFIT